MSSMNLFTMRLLIWWTTSLKEAEQSVAYEALKERFSDGDLSEIVEEIYELKEQGMLFYRRYI